MRKQKIFPLMMIFLIVTMSFFCTVKADTQILLASYDFANIDFASTIHASHPTTGIYDSARWETFTVSSNAYLTYVYARLKIVDQAHTATGTIHCSINNVTSQAYNSRPTDEVLALSSSSYNFAQMSSTNYYTFMFIFNQTYQLTTSTYYALVFYATDVTNMNDNNYFAVGADASSPSYNGYHNTYKSSAWQTPATTVDTCFEMYGTEAPVATPTPAPTPTPESASLRIFTTGSGSYTKNANAPYYEGQQITFTFTPSPNWNFTDFNYYTTTFIHNSSNPIVYTVRAGVNSLGIVFTYNGTEDFTDVTNPPDLTWIWNGTHWNPPPDTTDKITPVANSISDFLFGSTGVLGAGFGLVVLLVVALILWKLAGKSLEVLMLAVIVATIINVSVGIWELWTIILVIIAVVAIALKNSGVLNSNGE